MFFGVKSFPLHPNPIFTHTIKRIRSRSTLHCSFCPLLIRSCSKFGRKNLARWLSFFDLPISFSSTLRLRPSKPLIATTSCGLLSGIQHYPNWSQFGYAFRHAHPGPNPYFTLINGTNMDFEMSEMVVLVTHLLTSDPAPFASMKKTALQESKELDECTKQVGLLMVVNLSV